MNDNDKQNLMEDAEDEGLRAVMGSKFQDVSREIHTSPAAPRNDKVRREMEQKYPSYLGTVADKKHTVPEGEWKSVPTYAPNWFDRLKGCGKYAMICGLMVAVFWYWNITGLMASSAAIPCMLACGTYGGFKIGNVCRR